MQFPDLKVEVYTKSLKTLIYAPMFVEYFNYFQLVLTTIAKNTKMYRECHHLVFDSAAFKQFVTRSNKKKLYSFLLKFQVR